MKHDLRRVLALFLALLLALPSFAFAEDLDAVVSGEIEPPVVETGPIELGGDGLDLSEGVESDGLTIAPPEDVPQELQPDEPLIEAPSLTSFDQSVTLDGATFTVTADAVLRVEAVQDVAIAQAVEAALGEGVYAHRLYRIVVTDADGHVALPNDQQGEPVVRVEGLNLSEDARVVMFDAVQETVFDIDATVEADANAIAFCLQDAAVYDIVTVDSLPKQDEELAEDIGDDEPLGEPALDAEPTEDAEDISEEPEVSAQPVAVAFEVTPETAVVTVRPAAHSLPL